jgi:hypothetical protein
MTAEPLTLGEEAELRYVIDQSIREDYHYSIRSGPRR